jgi:transglutaminase-like putative cysteine protease
MMESVLRIRHETVYTYSDPVHYSIQTLKLTPRRDPGQRIVRWNIQVPGQRLEQIDPFGNLTQVVTLDTPHRELRIVVEGLVQIERSDQQELMDAGPLPPLVFLATTALTQPDATLRALAERALGRHPPTAANLMLLAEAVGAAVRYTPGATEVHHGAAQALALGEGVCQDQAHVFVACCRAVGVPARYVSGYVHAGAGVIASHAWAEAWLGPEHGWHSIDITHNELAGARHCRIAVGRDYLDAAPVRGVRRGGSTESMHVAVTVSNGAHQ